MGEVGGTTLGFYGAVFSPDGQSIVGHGYLGAFHLWNNVAYEVEVYDCKVLVFSENIM